MRIIVSTDINLPAATTWEKAGEQFGDTGEWSARLTSSYLDREEVGVGARRVCHNRDDVVTEEIETWDPERRSLSYTLIERPAWLSAVTNAWTVHEKGPDRSTLEMELTMEPAWFMKPLSPLVRLGIRRVLRTAQDEFRHWAETGEPHPRKVAYNTRHARWRNPEIVGLRN